MSSRSGKWRRKERDFVRDFQVLSEVMRERNSKEAIGARSGITPSSVYSMLDPHRKEVSVNLVKKLCDGLDMTLSEFFSAKVFDELEQEIQ